MATFSADTGRMKLRAKPTIKIGSQFSKPDHNIFSTDPPAETPHRMRKAVPIEEIEEDLSTLRVGKRHIEEPSVHPEERKVFGSTSYDPQMSDRFKSTRRYEGSGNVITGDVGNDAFESRRPAKAIQQEQHSSVARSIIQHSTEAPPASEQRSVRAQHENRLKQHRSYCPFAVDDGYNPEEEKVKELHPSNITHGNVLTGGNMLPQHASRRW